MPICSTFSSVHSIVLACDTSAYEIGAVLSHNFVNGSEKPIGFMSFKNINRYICREEIPHSQVEKRSSMYFQSVTILYLLVWSQVYISDRKQTGHIFIWILQECSTASIWQNSVLVLELAMYEYVLQFHQMVQHDNADALSRLPLPETIDTVSLPGELIRFIDHLAEGPITAAQLKLGEFKILFWQKYFTLPEMAGLITQMIQIWNYALLKNEKLPSWMVA